MNIVFYFSGTGNSLKAAKDILDRLGGGELVCMAAEGYEFAGSYDTIGFVYPVYFAGVPNAVRRFVSGLDMSGQKGAYCYAVATFGGKEFDGVALLGKLLKKRGVRLNYGRGLKMFSNYVNMYDMSDNVEQISLRSDEGIRLAAEEISGRQENVVRGVNPVFELMHNLMFVKKAAGLDRYYSVGDDCTGCGVCAEVCPVGNIEIAEGRPQFAHRCEQCVACIQFCPERTLNYKNATQDRGRYTNPDVGYAELAKRNNSGGTQYGV